MSSKIKTRIWVVIGGKGGVGKSFLITLIVQWLQMIGISFRLFDCDGETSTTSRFFPNIAEFLSISSADQIDKIVQCAVTEGKDIILVDLPARAGDDFEAWFAAVPWEELAQLGIRFGAIGVVSGAKDSIECIIRWREFLRDRVDYLIAVNERDLRRDIYIASNARKQFLADGIPEVSVPKLDERYAMELDRENWTLTHAIECRDPHFLTQLMSRARLRFYRAEIFERFNKLKQTLLP